jgi:hypothetical protein
MCARFNNIIAFFRVFFKSTVLPVLIEEEGMKARTNYVILLILLSAICIVPTSRHVLSAQYVECCNPLKIEILSPENKTYSTDSVPLCFTINKATSWIGYSLDWQANVTISGNTTLSNLSNGGHCVVVYANTTCGVMGASSPVYFTIDIVIPEFSSFLIAPLFMIATLLAVILYKRKRTIVQRST